MKGPSEIKKRLAEFAYKIGINKRQLTKIMGVSEVFFVSSGGMSEEKIAMVIEKYPQLNARWLLTGQGDMLVADSDKGGEEITEEPKPITPALRIKGIEEMRSETVKQADKDGTLDLVKAMGEIVNGVIAIQKEIGTAQLDLLKVLVKIFMKLDADTDREEINLKLKKLDRKVEL